MSSLFFEPESFLLDAAKQAALEAVQGYNGLNPYTIGVAVQAAASVLRNGVEPPSARRVPDAWDVPSVEVSPRLRALESVATAARDGHGVHGPDCRLCDALRGLEEAS